MSSIYNDDIFKNEKYIIKNEKEKREEKCMLMIINLLLLFSMLLYGINYTLMKYFIKLNGSVYIFIILRTVLTIPLMIYMYKSKESKPEKKKLLYNVLEDVPKENVNGKKITPTVNNEYDTYNKIDYEFNQYDDFMIYYNNNNNNYNYIRYDSYNNNSYNYISSSGYDNKYGKEKDKECMPAGSSNNYYLGRINDDEIVIPKAAYIPIIILSVAGAIRQIIVIVALQYTDSHNVGIIQPTIPVFTALLSCYMKLEKLNYITFLSILLSVIGLGITTQIWNINAFDFGLLLLLTVPITKGLQVIYINIAAKYVSNRIIQFYQMAFLLMIALPYGIIGEIVINKKYNIIHEICNLNITQLFCVVYSTVAIIFICWKIQIVSLNYLSPITVSLYQSSQPCFTFILAKIFLNETINLYKIIGTIFIILSLFLYQYGCYIKTKR